MSRSINSPKGQAREVDFGFSRMRFQQLLNRVLGSAQTVNQLNRAMIELERRNSVVERRETINWLSESLGEKRFFFERYGLPKFHRNDTPSSAQLFEAIRKWSLELATFSQLAGLLGPTSHRRLFSTRFLTFYSLPDQSGPLVIAWAGGARRLMMPPANYLPFLSRRETNLLLISPDAFTGYGQGLGRLGSTLFDVSAFLRRFIQEIGTDEVHVFGTSLGSIPALLTAPSVGAANCLVVGPPSPESESAQSVWGGIERSWRKSHGVKSCSLTITYGEKDEGDARAAEAITHSVGGSVLSVPEEGHNPVFGMFKRLELESWLTLYLFGDTASPPGTSVK